MNDNNSQDAFDLVGMGGKPLASPLTIDAAIQRLLPLGPLRRPGVRTCMAFRRRRKNKKPAVREPAGLVAIDPVRQLSLSGLPSARHAERLLAPRRSSNSAGLFRPAVAYEAVAFLAASRTLSADLRADDPTRFGRGADEQLLVVGQQLCWGLRPRSGLR